MNLWGVTIDALTRSEALKSLERKQLIFTPNPEILLEARRNLEFKRALHSGTLMLPDGHGLLFVSTLLRIRSRFVRVFAFVPALLLFLIWKKPFTRVLPEVIHGSDFMDEVVHFAAAHQYSVFFLGGQGVAEATAQHFLKKYPRLRVAGFSSKDPSPAAFEEVKVSQAQVVFVAYGAPKQELWMAEYAKKLPHLIHMMAVGGSFDFYSGKIKRAPRVLRTLGLEWLWRLLLHPIQRTRRIWNAVVEFPIVSLFDK